MKSHLVARLGFWETRGLLLRAWINLRCGLGLHEWCYDPNTLDSIGRSLRRVCLRCPVAQRAYLCPNYAHRCWERVR